jgi:DNA gyrase subunit A
MAVVTENDVILTVCAKGYGKRTAVSEYRSTGRGGKGVINIRCTEKNGRVVDMLPVTEKDDLMLMTQAGKMVRIPAGEISLIGRNTQGVRCMRLAEGDRIVSSSIVAEEKVENGSEPQVEEER